MAEFAMGYASLVGRQWRSPNTSIQNISGLPQGPVHPFGGRLNWAPRRTRHERAGYRGETGLGFRHRVSRGVFDPGPPGHASVGTRPGLKDTAVPGWQPLARDTQPTREVGSAHETPRFHRAARRRCGCAAGGSAGAASGDAMKTLSIITERRATDFPSTERNSP